VPRFAEQVTRLEAFGSERAMLAVRSCIHLQPALLETSGAGYIYGSQSVQQHWTWNLRTAPKPRFPAAGLT